MRQKWNFVEVMQKIQEKFFVFILSYSSVTKIPGYIHNFEVLGRRYLSENPYYQQLSGEKKAGNAPESGVQISKFIFYVLQSYLMA